MRAAARLNADQARRQVDEVRRHLRSLELLPQNYLTVIIDAVDLQHVLCQIDAQCCNLHVGRSCPFKWVGKHLHFGTLRCRLSGGVHPIGRRQHYVILDARYERVREAGRLVDCAVLVAIGVTASGHRRVLGVSVELSEAEVHWRAFLDSLIQRGLRGVKFIASVDHAGLKAARKAMFPGVPWQRCQFHPQQNAQGYVTRLDQRKPVARQICGIFNAPDAHEAQRLLNNALKDWQLSHPQLAVWAEISLPEGFAVFGLPDAHYQRIRAIEQGTQTANTCRNAVSQLRQLPAPGQRFVGRTR